MKYVVWETMNGEIFEEVAEFDSILKAEKFIESCAWATDYHQKLLDPVIEIVDDDFKTPEYIKNKFEKRFRAKWMSF